MVPATRLDLLDCPRAVRDVQITCAAVDSPHRMTAPKPFKLVAIVWFFGQRFEASIDLPFEPNAEEAEYIKAEVARRLASRLAEATADGGIAH